jgi:hypothetical protein
LLQSLYNDKATYIYSASINNESKTIGGIAVVFDAEVEFLAMINESFPSSKKGFMLFIDQNKRVISSNNENISILNKIDVDDKFVNIKTEHTVHDYIIFQNREYLLSSVISKGYREYKRADNYSNTVFCLTFIEV